MVWPGCLGEMYVLTPTTIRTSRRRRRSITSCGSYSTLSIVYTDWRNRLCSNEYGFQPSLPLLPLPPPHVPAPISGRCTYHRGGKAHSRGKYQPGGRRRRRSKLRVVGCELALVSIRLWQKWSNPINTDNPDMMDGVEKGEGEGC